ncbi:lipoprotein, putative [Acidithiobacillus ferrooxidans ATCC 23270]|uniref:Lipoprotein, putative n=1 Tax=Acidithiobacillus ferrooxidans (strain ATCC 23270 / DSM 14882 / CIP 104768 / NCIMB 8455) TaxID=243159 RepID=B7J877_ACIF2|nr:lipoprotein, putative [Acidithiobacillus ferrooxidans ATCC 23270]
MKKIKLLLLPVAILAAAGCSQSVPTGSVGIWHNRFTGYINRR